MHFYQKLTSFILMGVVSFTTIPQSHAVITKILKPVVKPKPKPKPPTVMGVLNGAVTVLALHSFIGKAQASDHEYTEQGLEFIENGTTIYIGINCEAKSSKYGEGKWKWDSSGWRVEMQNTKEVTQIEYDYADLPAFSKAVMNKCRA